VTVIADRRRGDRRRPRGGEHDPERRRRDRRRCDIDDLLRVHGWGEVILSQD
jgi:hypothetical protein